MNQFIKLTIVFFFAISLVFTQETEEPEESKEISDYLEEDKIVGGYEINITAAPYQVSLRRYSYHICGGSIISESYVLTAAHCTLGMMASKLSVR